jgi:hypothetical protein
MIVVLLYVGKILSILKCSGDVFRFAAAESNLSVVFYLINQDHDTYGLLDDKKVHRYVGCDIIKLCYFIIIT